MRYNRYFVSMIRFFFIFIFLATASLSVFGSETDSLKLLLQENQFVDTRAKIETLILLAKKQLYTSPDESIENGLAALKEAKGTGNALLIARVAKQVGSFYHWQSDFANALEYFNLALKNYVASNDIEGQAACYNNLGVVFNRLGYYDVALENHLRQLKINEQTGDLKGIAISNRNIGNIYNNMGENARALDYYLTAMTISERLQDTSSVATTLINMGVTSMEVQSYDQAITYFNEALEIKQRLNDKKNICVIYSNLGVVFKSLEKYPEAIHYFVKSLDVSRQINYRHAMAVALINLGDVYLIEGEKAKSFRYLNQALQIAHEIDSKQLISDVYALLSKWYEDAENYRQSLEYFKMQTRLQDSLLGVEKGRHLRNLQIVYEVEKKEKEILEQSVSIQRLETNQIFLMLIIVIALSLAFVVYYRYRTKKKLTYQLEGKIAEALRKEKEQQLIIVHQASLTSLGELAAGIAHEIKQPLQNISLANEGLQIENLEGNINTKLVADTTDDISEGIKRIKFIITEISNFSRGQLEQLSELFDVNTRIENAFSLARTKFSNRRIDVQFELDKTIPKILGNPYKFEQVIVNFFNNAKDAIEEKAEKTGLEFMKKMTVKSYTKNEMLNIEVADNGIGIPESIKTNIFLPFYTTKDLGKGTGLGLSISLGIAKEMGGIIEIESEEMKGTLMRLKLPLNKK